MGFLWGSGTVSRRCGVSVGSPRPLAGSADRRGVPRGRGFRTPMTTFLETQRHRCHLPACDNSAPIPRASCGLTRDHCLRRRSSRYGCRRPRQSPRAGMILDRAVSLRSCPAASGLPSAMSGCPRQGVVCPAVHPELVVGGQCPCELVARLLVVAASDQHAGVVAARVGGPGAGAASLVELDRCLEVLCGLLEPAGLWQPACREPGRQRRTRSRAGRRRAARGMAAASRRA